MSQHECKRCGETKDAAEMCQRNGKPSKLCRVCFAAACRKAEGGGSTVKRKREPAAAPAVDPDIERGPALSIAPGLGVEAWIENGCLQLSQGEDVVALSRVEFSALAARFGEWSKS